MQVISRMVIGLTVFHKKVIYNAELRLQHLNKLPVVLKVNLLGYWLSSFYDKGLHLWPSLSLVGHFQAMPSID